MSLKHVVIALVIYWATHTLVIIDFSLVLGLVSSKLPYTLEGCQMTTVYARFKIVNRDYTYYVYTQSYD